MTEMSLSPWSTDDIAKGFCSEIRARFEALNRVARGRDSFAWCVYQASEIRIICNKVTIVLPRGYAVGLDFVHLFDRTSVAWSRPFIGAAVVDGEARPTIEIALVDSWDSDREAQWLRDGQWRRRVLVELFEEDARALAVAGDHHGACNCGDYPASDRPCLFCAGMPVSAEVLRKIRDPLRSALELA